MVATHDLALAHLACDEVCLLNRRQFGFGPPGRRSPRNGCAPTYGGHALELRGDRVIVAHS